MFCGYNKFLNQLLLCANSAKPLVCWISDNKDVLNLFHWLFKLQSKSGQKCGNDGNESPSEGKWLEGKKREKNIACFNVVGTLLVDGELNDLVPFSTFNILWS